MQAWFNFYAVIGAVAATLMGLLFVAMSMNAFAVLSRGPEGSRRFAEQAFENYLAVLMVSLLALFPDMRITTFGRVTLLVTATWTAWVIVRLYQAVAVPSVHETRLVAIRRHLSTLIGFGMLIYAAGRMAFGAHATRWRRPPSCCCSQPLKGLGDCSIGSPRARGTDRHRRTSTYFTTTGGPGP
jgi:hypothetical protein